MRLDRVVVGIDFSPASLAALERARSLAAPDGALSLLHVVDVAVAPVHADRRAVEALYERLVESARLELDGLAAQLRAGGARADGCVTTGRPADELLSFASRERADLVVVGAHARSVLGRLALGSVAEEVARRSVMPTLVVRELAEAGGTRIGRVLVAVDREPSSRDAARAGADLARRLGVPLEAVHAIEIPAVPAYAAGSIAFPTDLPSGLPDGLRCAIGGELARADGREVAVHFVAGPAAREIVRFARRDDVLVCGTHGRGTLGRLAFGSVATKLLRRAPCPVLVVRPGACEGQDASAAATGATDRTPPAARGELARERQAQSMACACGGGASKAKESAANAAEASG